MVKAIQVQHDGSMERMFECVAKAGFKYVSLGFGSTKAFHNDDWKSVAPYIKSKLQENGLTCVQTHLPYYDLKLSSEILIDEMEEAIKRCIIASAELGAKVCVYHPRSSVTKDFSAKASLADNVKVITEYNEVAKKAGIGIALENLPIFPDIQHLRFYTYDYEDLCELVDALDENVTVCWDFGHAHLTKFDHAQGLRYVGKRLSCTHIHNNNRWDDDHNVPSVGSINWEELMPVLKEIGYEGPLTLEVGYRNNPTLESYTNHCYSCIEYLESLIEAE